MRGLIFDGSKPRFTTDLPEPQPGRGEALIRPTRMGVCSTDLEICRGYMDFKGVLGHEFVGVVEAVGAKADARWVGKRVVGNINCVCGKCDMCKGGVSEHCRDRTVLGIAGRDGCFAELFTLPIRNLLEVPETLDDDRAVFTEPVAAAYQVTRQLTIEGRPFVTVLGDGRLGLLCAQVLSKLNATVRLIGRHEEKLELCTKWKIKHRLLDDVGLRADQDIVVDCTGSPDGLGTAMAMVRPRGRIVLKTTIAPPASRGSGTDGASLDLTPLVVHEIQLIGSRCGPMPEALYALATDQVDVLPMISRRFKLDKALDALKLAASKQPDVIKVLIEA